MAVGGVPMFPPTWQGTPAVPRMCPIIAVVVVFPFAPVMPLLDFAKLDDVIKAANNTRYGLAAYVFTNDLTVALRMAEGLEAGIIGINDPVPAVRSAALEALKKF